jgi:DNA-binding SARP family transcriptional activator
MNGNSETPRVLVFGAADALGGEAARRLIRQPKAFFVLTYLLLARPRGLQSRDRIVTMFWPDQDEPRARGSLRATLHVLRESLGPGAVLREGDTRVGVDNRFVTCDAVDFDAAIEAGKLARALELYRGPLLDQFFGESPAADHWLDQERERFRTAAADAAWSLASRYEHDADLTHAAKWARRAAQLAGPDERRIRKVMALLDTAGDRAGAIVVYDQFVKYLASALEVEPSAETRALVDAIRSGNRSS